MGILVEFWYGTVTVILGSFSQIVGMMKKFWNV